MYRAVLELILMLFQLKQTSAKTRLLISFLFTAKSCARITQCQRNALLIVWFRREVYFYFLIHVVLGFLMQMQNRPTQHATAIGEDRP